MKFYKGAYENSVITENAPLGSFIAQFFTHLSFCERSGRLEMNSALERSLDEGELIDLDSTQIEVFSEMSTRNKEKKMEKRDKRTPSPRDVTNPLEFLPKFVPAKGGISVEKAGVVEEKKDKNGRVLYKYSVSWTEDADIPKQDAPYEMISIEETGAKGNMDKNMDNVKKEGIRCDGPCGKMIYGVEMMQFGDCDHNICPKCNRTESTVKLYDGTPGCCSLKCVKNALAMENSAKRNCSASSKSSTSFGLKTDPIQMINLNIFFFTNDERGRTIRKTYEREIQPTTHLHQMKRTLKGIVPFLDCCDVFYAAGEVAEFAEMTRLVAFDRIKISQLVFGSVNLNILVVAPGVPLNKLRLPIL